MRGNKSTFLNSGGFPPTTLKFLDFHNFGRLETYVITSLPQAGKDRKAKGGGSPEFIFNSNN